MTPNQYKFFNTADFHETYRIAKIQFRKIISDFNEEKFREEFEELFLDKSESYHTLFLKKDEQLICGGLNFIAEGAIFCDIFFLNLFFFSLTMNEIRVFFGKLCLEAKQKNVNYLILPLDKNRLKYKSFRRYCERLFFTKNEKVLVDVELKEEYENHHLLLVNSDEYLEKIKGVGLDIKAYS